MTTMVCFQSGGTAYCMPVDSTRAVRTVDGLLALPGARPDIVGIVPGKPPLTVIGALGSSGRQILEVEAGGTAFGLLVESVTGLRQIDSSDIRPAPAGQDQAFISGTIDLNGTLMLLTDPLALAARL